MNAVSLATLESSKVVSIEFYAAVRVGMRNEMDTGKRNEEDKQNSNKIRENIKSFPIDGLKGRIRGRKSPSQVFFIFPNWRTNIIFQYKVHSTLWRGWVGWLVFIEHTHRPDRHHVGAIWSIVTFYVDLGLLCVELQWDARSSH